MSLNDLSYEIIGTAIRIHSELGSGLREAVYEAALASELRRGGHDVGQQVVIPITVGGRRIGKGARIDLIVDGQIALEVKSARGISMQDVKQIVTYLKVLDLRLGLILNFGVASLREGIKRVVNQL